MDQTTEAIIDVAPFPLVLLGPDERILRVNGAAAQLFGRGLDGRHYVTALRAPSVVRCIETVFAGATARSEALYHTAEASREATWRVIATRLPETAGGGALVSFEDATAVQEAGQIRRDFVANVSHELRTPLTALMGFIETLRGPARDDAAARERFLGIMEREAVRMNRLVRDLLSLSRVESEERVRPTGEVELTGLVRSVAAMLRPVAEQAGVLVRLDFAEDRRVVRGDADQLMQVFTNLVENGIKYGGQGATVTVSVSAPARDALLRGEAVTAAVCDDGEGIDPIHLPRLTERFYRVDAHRSREKGGTGLGLAIVKHIVNRHRGRMTIDSAPGEGSVFKVILPLP